MTPTPPQPNNPCTCLEGVPNSVGDCPIHGQSLRNNPGYTPEYKEIEEARCHADDLAHEAKGRLKPEGLDLELLNQQWLAAEVRLMRLERALER